MTPDDASTTRQRPLFDFRFCPVEDSTIFGEQDSDWDVYCAAVGWYDRRKLSTLPIAPPPAIWFLRLGDTIRVRWDNRDIREDGIQIWSASVGEIALSVDDFMAEVASFDGRLIAGMRERIDAAVAYWSRPDREIDTTHLLRDHAGRESARRDRLAIPLTPTDWHAVRNALATLDL